MNDSNKIKVGLLLDDLTVPFWVNSLINALRKDSRFVIHCVVLNVGTKPKSRSSFVYRLLRKADERLMALPGNPFKRVVLDVKTKNIIEVEPIRKKFSDYFPDEVIQKIEQDRPDIFLRFGFRILRGKILAAARYGIFSLHHGDTATFRGGPPAFWEVVKKAPVTAVTLQVLTEALDAGVILAKVFLRTDNTSFYRNQQKIYWAGYQLFLDQLGKLPQYGIENYINSQKPIFANEPKGKLYRNPQNFSSAFILVQYLLRGLSRFCSNKLFNNQWQILIGQKTNLSLQEKPNKFFSLTPPKDRIWADPFIAKHNDKYYLLFEEKLNQSKHAHISCLELNEKGEPLSKNPVVVVKENYHLSYPFVFSHNNQFYMIPESAEDKSVVMYRSVNFPYQWEKERILLDDKLIYDTTLHHHSDGRWYLFCTEKEDSRFSSDAYFHIYYADSPEGPFLPHPKNPVYSDVRKSRPAGALFYQNENLIRPAQISAPHYGFGIAYFNVLTLSPDDYKEELIFEEFPQDGYQSTHTINQLDSLVVYDVQKKVFKI